MTFSDDALREEAELVARLKRHDTAAFEALVRRHSRRLIAVARQILGDEDLARDAVQDGFLNAYRGIQGFNGEARLGSWLHRIVTNAALGKIRRRQRRPESFLIEALGAGCDDDPLAQTRLPAHLAESESADASLERRQERRFVRACIARMKAKHRSVLTLRYLEELDTEQTARVLGIAPNTVKTRLLRARDALRAHIESEPGLASAVLRRPLPAGREPRRAV